MRITPSILVRWLLAAIITIASLPTLAAVVERGPYLQQATSNNITVRWRTDVATDAVVRFGTEASTLNRVASGSQSGTDHEVTVSGLVPGTRYYYSVGDSTETLAGGDSTFTFRTSPTTGTAENTRVWVIGDSGTANSNARAVRDTYVSYSASRPADVWLMLGDNAYSDGTDAEYQDAVFDTYPTILRNTPLWSTLGNHDGHSANSDNEQGPYYDIFTFPRNAEVGGIASGTEAYYSFDYGNIHFVTLDSYDTDRSVGGAMLTWLENDLATASQKWLIAFWHHPPYTKGSHNSDTEGRLIDMRERVLPILESYGVDLVLSGHSHSYERSFLVDSHYDTSDTFSASMLIDGGSGREDGSGAYTKTPGSPNQGAVYAVAGSSGKTGGGSLDHPVMFFSLAGLGSMVLDIDGDRLDVAFINSTGGQDDYFTIDKSTSSGDTEAPSPVSNLASTNVATTSLTLNWHAATDNVGVSSYRVSRDGTVIGNANMLTFDDTNLTPDTAYSYSVIALDAAGNESVPVLVAATTQAVSGGAPSSGGGAIDITSLFAMAALLILLRRHELPAPARRTLCATLLLAAPTLALSHEDVDLQLATVHAQLSENPDNYRLHAKRGELLGLHDDWRLAVISLRQAQALAPNAAASILDLRIGEALYRSENPAKAQPYVERYLSTHEESSVGWRAHARIMSGLNQTDASLRSFNNAIQHANSPTPELFFERARVLEHHPSRTDELLTGIDDGVQTLGPLMTFLEYAIDIEWQRENYVAVIARMDALPEPIKQQPRWLLRRSAALLNSGQRAEAENVNRLALQTIDSLPLQRRNMKAYIALRAEIERSYGRMKRQL